MYPEYIGCLVCRFSNFLASWWDIIIKKEYVKCYELISNQIDGQFDRIPTNILKLCSYQLIRRNVGMTNVDLAYIGFAHF